MLVVVEPLLMPNARIMGWKSVPASDDPEDKRVKSIKAPSWEPLVPELPEDFVGIFVPYGAAHQYKAMLVWCEEQGGKPGPLGWFVMSKPVAKEFISHFHLRFQNGMK